MSSLTESVKSYLTPSVIGRISTSLHENDADLYKAATGYSTAIMGGIASRSNDGSFVESVFGLLRSNELSETLQQPTALLQESDNGSSSKSISDKVVASVFGNQVTELVNGVAQYAGIKPPSSRSLLSVIGPMVMGVLHKKIMAGNLNADGFASLMTGEKAKLLGSIPPGIGSALGMAGLVSPMHTIDELPAPGMRGNWVVPVLVVLTLLIAFVIWRGCQ